jgi:hypothetical protein
MHSLISALALLPMLLCLSPSPSGVGRTADSKPTVIVLIAPDCDAGCGCPAEALPVVHTSDFCLDQQTQNIVVSVGGCCSEAQLPGCTSDWAGCLMGKHERRLKLKGGFCSCTSMDYATSGAGSNESQSGLGVGVWSKWILIGDFGMQCDAAGSRAQQNLTATCTAGGTPVPRTLLNIDFDFYCDACGG